MRTIFVYGTLMAGFHNHAHYLGTSVKAGESTLVGRDSIEGLQMLHLGGFPGVVPKQGSTIVGEVYEIPDALVPMLDRLEGHPTFYRRTEATTVGGISVEVYVLADPTIYEGRYSVVASGDWHRRGERAVGQEG